jgi:CRP/FNR family cyclic AMP-dependent transcriptional regulator
MSMNENEEVQREVYKPGEYIFFEGDIDFHFYIVEAGQVSIFTKGQDGHKIHIAEVNGGESFGEFALLDRKPRSASAQAVVETTVFKVSESGYERLLEELPVWASTMLKSFATRLRKMNAVLAQI